ncbi:MAG TPA: electron transport complex subunit RsxC, partial [Thauera aminoaromatica]|nr:electron transport complex subunit RsxC [Thauera aminoaromatica]
MLRELFRFHGGVKPATNKSASTTSPIAKAPIPARLVVPLHQSLGSPAIALVEPGQRVLKGERIGAAGGRLSAAIHAPTSGVVRAVEPALV